MEKLAILGGKPYVNEGAPKELFKWPIITEEDEQAIMDVIRNNKFSGTDITQKFENEFKDWIGRKHAICYTNGTLSLAAAMFSIGLGAGDEIICPTKTYWASIVQSAIFGASAVFCNITDNFSTCANDTRHNIFLTTKHSSKLQKHNTSKFSHNKLQSLFCFNKHHRVKRHTIIQNFIMKMRSG